MAEINDRALQLAAAAGKIMLESGAETYRVEDTMERILESFLNKSCEVFVTTTGLFVSDGEKTILKRVKIRGIHIGRIAEVNELSRQIADGLHIDAAERRIRKIEAIKPYSLPVQIAATALSCAAFSYLYGGAVSDCSDSFIIGVVLGLTLYLLEKPFPSSFLPSLAGGMVVAGGAVLLSSLGMGTDIDKVIIGSIMPLVPGVRLTNAVRDILEGDFLSGSSRVLDAALIAVATAAGVGLVLKFYYAP